ncbi:Protein CBR-FLP-2 [Caenorhabditis briggsae]|uniref:Uncharacterized protein n=2 Tax=Caenorhabditis briggsae TaxID=6238 RepID=A0AAE8ZNH5_CAEBR|nr:Protein CBR-FLP-2 [Caenorhabditis briggsae]ULT80496.1 hypothetical protein L3Y34_010807 [Caenorhabditis briggsae]UMM39794.1 hypothetical protein L5515_016690 [Caenorhabditis briggsae]CAP23165.1 Protein CBR-FLP-2 [Caenorhabditis briggsae]
MQASAILSALFLVLLAVIGTTVAQSNDNQLGVFEASMMAKRLRGEPIRFGKRSPREPIRFGKRFNPLPDYDFQ